LADEVQIKFGADIGDALSALNALKQAVTGVTAPVTQLKSAFANASAALQQNSAATVAAFKADMQQMVAQHAISLGQALGFDIEYTAQRSAEERARLEAVLASDAATLSEKSASYAQLADLSARYSAQLAQDQMRIAQAAQRVAEKIAQPFKKAFDGIGTSFETAVTDLLLHKGTTQNIGRQLYQSIVGQGVSLAGSTLSMAAAGALGGREGEGLGSYLSRQVAELILHSSLLAGILGNTAETAVASSAGAATSAAGSVAGGGLFSWVGGLLGFAAGGIVPSAARGWALPNFAGATPALLHSREMVLPAPLSEGLQSMIAQGGSGGDMHLHFHGPSDGPAVERWFTGLMARNPGVLRNMMRSNALTPRTI
jgi:hypothetical protein